MILQKESSKELESLYVDNDEAALDSMLRMALSPLLGFTRDGKIISKDPYLRLSLPARILSSLLARLAMVRLGVPGAKAESTAEDLAEDCLAEVKACRECLSRLKGRKLLDRNQGGYFLPIWAASKAVAEIRKD